MLNAVLALCSHFTGARPDAVSPAAKKIIVQDRDNEVKNRNGTTIINCYFDIHHNKAHSMVWRQPKVTFCLSFVNGFETKLLLQPPDFTSLKTN